MKTGARVVLSILVGLGVFVALFPGRSAGPVMAVHSKQHEGHQRGFGARALDRCSGLI